MFIRAWSPSWDAGHVAAHGMSMVENGVAGRRQRCHCRCPAVGAGLNQAPGVGCGVRDGAGDAGAQLVSGWRWCSLRNTSRWSMTPSSSQDLDLAQPAFALAAVEHHVHAGRCRGPPAWSGRADGGLDVQPRNPHDELLGVEPAAVAEGLVAQVRQIGSPRSAQARRTASISRIGPHMYSSALSRRRPRPTMITATRPAACPRRPRARAAGRRAAPPVPQVGHRGAAAAGVDERCSRPSLP